MQADKLRELRELLAKATPGPWQSMNPYQWDSIIGDIDGPDDGDMHYEGVADITYDHARSRANAALISAAVNALPELLAIAEASEWQPIDSAPLGGSILVLLSEPMLGSWMHAANWHANVKTIGCVFSFDAPKATHWRPLPKAPEGLVRVVGE